jgi:hypothetical protein
VFTRSLTLSWVPCSVHTVKSDSGDELTAAAIARLAGVGRAAVSNWRRRYPDFPKPVGGSPSSPTFSRVDVEAWLTATGKSGQLATAGRTDTGTHRIGGPTDQLDIRDREAVQGLHEDLSENSVTSISPAQMLARVMVSLLPRSLGTSPAVDDDVAPLVDAVIDPACFQATLLMAAADRFGDRVKLAGQDIDESATAFASLNLRGRVDCVPYEIQTGDSLLDSRLDRYLGLAAAVVCEPPLDMSAWPSNELATDPRWVFGVPDSRDGELAWVQLCYAYLRPGGIAVVAISPRTCIQPSGQRIRAALVRSGVLRDVIALPKQMGSLKTNVYLWVLQRPYGPVNNLTVRMTDLSTLNDAADVPYDFAAWQRLFDDADPAISRPVSWVELLDGETDLLPSRYVVARVNATATELAAVTNRLEELYLRVGQGLPRFAAPESPTNHSYVTLAELERVGALRIRSRDTTPRNGDVLLRTLGRPPTVATGTDADDVGVAQVVELDTRRLDPDFVATFLRIDANSLPVANTLGALSRDDLRRCRIPRLQLAEQRRYGYVFRHLRELQGATSALAKVSENVIDQTIHGLTLGALSPELLSR